MIDLLIACTAGVAAAYIATALQAGGMQWTLPDSYRLPIALGTFLMPGTLNWVGAYRSWRGLSLDAELRPHVLGVGMVFLVLGVIALVTKTTGLYSRVWMGSWFLLSLVGIATSRVIVRGVLHTMHARGFDTRVVALVGGGPLAARVAQHLQENRDVGLKPVGYFAAEPHEGSGSFLPCMGRIDDIAAVLDRREEAVSQLWIVLPLSAESTIRKILHDLRHSTIDIRMVPDMFSYQLVHCSTENVVGLPVLNLSYSPLSGANRYAKELLDRLLAVFILIGISPLMLLIAAAIKLTSPGPAIFKQTRHGGDGEPFTVYKFRTLRVGPPPVQSDQVTRNDPRVTRLGLFLRRTSLDELPQFFNVIEGTMSIVGPRPHPVALNDLYRDQVERYMWRHKVKPGITGWAQVNGLRGETDTLDKMVARVEHDLAYIRNWSPWLDIKILFLTAFGRKVRQ
ncbi:MAG: undecaprenyl-phosphate glucose phosphotransferase, partial [Gammaproteobacteria bacterium]